MPPSVRLPRQRGEAARRFPGPGRQIDESMAVAIDGETYLAQLKPESEIYLIPKIGGG